MERDVRLRGLEQENDGKSCENGCVKNFSWEESEIN